MPTIKPKDIMSVNHESVKIDGWDVMFKHHTTRALVLQVLVESIRGKSYSPTNQELLEGVIARQQELGLKPLSQLSRKSIQSALDVLLDEGYIYQTNSAGTEPDEKGNRPRGRGGAARCYWPRCIDPVLVQDE